MYENLRFKKENGIWYIDLPNWIGPKHALSMVAGADKLLDLYNKYSVKKNDIVELGVNTDCGLHSKGAGDLRLKKIESSLLGGATYKTGIKEVPTIWLGPVTLFVLHEYPEGMYIDFKRDFMTPSRSYFTYDNRPGTGPETKISYDFNDWDGDMADCNIAVEMYNQGDSISEIAETLEKSERKIREILVLQCAKYVEDHPEDCAVIEYETYNGSISYIAKDLDITEEKVREYLSAGSEKYRREHPAE